MEYKIKNDLDKNVFRGYDIRGVYQKNIDEDFADTLYDFNNKGLTDETNNIYLYAGSYVNEYGYEREVERDSSLAGLVIQFIL